MIFHTGYQYAPPLEGHWLSNPCREMAVDHHHRGDHVDTHDGPGIYLGHDGGTHLVSLDSDSCGDIPGFGDTDLRPIREG